MNGVAIEGYGVGAPNFLYKVVSADEWQESQSQGQLICSPSDTQFIHLAMEEQVTHVIQKFWRGSDSVVLKLLTSRLQGRLSYESNPGGSTKYYHLYDGIIPLDAVLEAKAVHCATFDPLH